MEKKARGKREHTSLAVIERDGRLGAKMRLFFFLLQVHEHVILPRSVRQRGGDNLMALSNSDSPQELSSPLLGNIGKVQILGYTFSQSSMPVVEWLGLVTSSALIWMFVFVLRTYTGKA